MTFTSLEFTVFLPVVFALYWFAWPRSLKAQNLLLLIASYVFYGWWDYRFLMLIVISSSVDYFSALRIAGTENDSKKRAYLGLSLAANLGLLATFKYFNFFVASFAGAFTFFGMHLNTSSLRLVLPVGISFYTFQTLSYTIDVYRGRLKPTRDVVAFFAFVTFFPQLVAGPIERAANLLPQFFTQRAFCYHQAVDGLRQILWGVVKKVVIADNCARYVNIIFTDYSQLRGSTLLLGTFLFSFQIYGDFSGYSDIAIGVAKLFNFRLMRNFAYPYFSRDIAEFWRRWHISLSTWFRDYVYIPLGGSRGPMARRIRNTLVVFALSGLWHGANWTFVVWGILNALYFLPLMLLKRNRGNMEIASRGMLLPELSDLLAIISTFALTSVTWVFFRAESVPVALSFLHRMFSSSLFTVPQLRESIPTLILIFMFVAVEWLGREHEYALAAVGSVASRRVRWLAYAMACLAIVLYGQTTGSPFIYFQF